jgi:hypothetical protein
MGNGRKLAHGGKMANFEQCLHTRFLAFLVGGALAFCAGCGSSTAAGAPVPNCTPASVHACTPTRSRGCSLFVAGDGLTVSAAACSGGDARRGCIPPGDHLACVDACADVSDCS